MKLNQRRVVPQVGLILGAWLLGMWLASSALAGVSLAPRYKQWLEYDVAYIITDVEKKTFLALTTDEERDKFIKDFWDLRDPTPGTPENEFKEEHYRRIDYANRYFGLGSGTDGWRTDRGRMYILLGPPQQRAPYRYGQVVPIELWFYSDATHPGIPSSFTFFSTSAMRSVTIACTAPMWMVPVNSCMKRSPTNKPTNSWRISISS